MNHLRVDTWTRLGFSLLWDPAALARVASPGSVRSMREFFAMRDRWPDDLPSGGGNALVVAGLDGCLNALSDNDAVAWIEGDLKPAMRDFRDQYGLQGALILWVASGRANIAMNLAAGEYVWKTGPGRDATRLPLGRCLWAGAESSVARILISDEKYPDDDGPAFVGLHHPRIS